MSAIFDDDLLAGLTIEEDSKHGAKPKKKSSKSKILKGQCIIDFEQTDNKQNSLPENTSQAKKDHRQNFDKTRCFSNIRELLRRNPDAKIGQIEKEAGVRLGYMSRLEKDGNTSEPSIEFIAAAAKILNVSLDTLISINIAKLTPTEQYILDFFDKLKSDTLADKLEWHVETPGYLNSLEIETEPEYGYEYVDHPLFAQQHVYEGSADGRLGYVDRIVFNSHSFGVNTIIC